MSILRKIFNSFLSFFYRTKKTIEVIEDKKQQEQLEEAEIIRPWKFADPDPEEEGGRDLDESLRLKEKFLTAEKEMKIKISFKTRDPILQIAALETGEEEVILSLLRNPRLEEGILEQILLDSKYNKSEYRSELAKKFGLSLEIQKLIAKSDDLDIRREFVSWQKPLHPVIGLILAQDEDEWIRITMAKNIGEGIKVDNMLFFKGKYDQVYKVLMKDPLQKVRDSLAKNQNMGELIQKEMIQEFYSVGDLASLTQLAKNKSLKPAAQQLVLDISSQSRIRILDSRILKKALGENPSLHPEIKKALGK